MTATGAAVVAAGTSALARSGPTAERIDPARLGSPRRRAVAWTVDLATAVVPLAAIVWSQTDRSTVDTPASRLDRPGPDLILGHVRYHWTGSAVTLCLVAAVLLGLILQALVPANTGWTLGLRLVRLRVLSTDGTRARLFQHLVRNLVGVADLAPFVLPGLVGWWTASHSPLRQRLGDRAARTVVVERQHPERPVDPDGPGAHWWHLRADPLLADPTPLPGEQELLRRWLRQPVDDRAPTAPRTILASRAETVAPVDAAPITEAGRTPRFGRRRPPTGDGAIDDGAAAPATASGAGPGQPAGPDPDPVVHRPRFSRVPQPPQPNPLPEPTPAPAPRHRTGRNDLVAVPAGPEPTQPTEPDDQGAATVGGPDEPAWSDEHQAWVYIDPDSGRLFVHDAASGTWHPAP